MVLVVDMVMVVDMVVVVGNGCEQCRGTAMVESGHGRGHGRGMVCRGPFPQFQQHSNRIEKIEHYCSHIL
eukprot:COSAG01_NODE_3713_length_5770_cov_71.034568_5_plen_70_part_00